MANPCSDGQESAEFKDSLSSFRSWRAAWDIEELVSNKKENSTAEEGQGLGS